MTSSKQTFKKTHTQKTITIVKSFKCAHTHTNTHTHQNSVCFEPQLVGHWATPSLAARAIVRWIPSCPRQTCMLLSKQHSPPTNAWQSTETLPDVSGESLRTQKRTNSKKAVFQFLDGVQTCNPPALCACAIAVVSVFVQTLENK